MFAANMSENFQDEFWKQPWGDCGHKSCNFECSGWIYPYIGKRLWWDHHDRKRKLALKLRSMILIEGYEKQLWKTYPNHEGNLHTLCPKNINFQASTDKKFLAWNLETTVVIDILIRNCWQATLRPPCPFQPLGSPARPVFNCSWVNGEVPWAKVILSRQIIMF